MIEPKWWWSSQRTDYWFKAQTTLSEEKALIWAATNIALNTNQNIPDVAAKLRSEAEK